MSQDQPLGPLSIRAPEHNTLLSPLFSLSSRHFPALGSLGF